MDFLIATGDHTDTDLENELRCFIEIADGYIYQRTTLIEQGKKRWHR